MNILVVGNLPELGGYCDKNECFPVILYVHSEKLIKVIVAASRRHLTISSLIIRRFVCGFIFIRLMDYPTIESYKLGVHATVMSSASPCKQSSGTCPLTKASQPPSSKQPATFSATPPLRSILPSLTDYQLFAARISLSYLSAHSLSVTRL